MGKVYVATNELPRAEAVLKGVIGIDEKNIPAREDLFYVYLKEGNLDAANIILQEIVQIDPNKTVNQLKADLEAAKATKTKNAESTNDSTLTSASTSSTSTQISNSVLNEQVLQSRMAEIIYTKPLIEKLISQGSRMGQHLSCYLDMSKNIAYFGEFTSEQDSNGVIAKSIVVRVHNPKIYPASVIPDVNTNEADIIAKEIVDKYNAAKVMEFKAPKHLNAFFPVIIEGNDFEGNLLRTGLQSDDMVYIDF